MKNKKIVFKKKKKREPLIFLQLRKKANVEGLGESLIAHFYEIV